MRPYFIPVIKVVFERDRATGDAVVDEGGIGRPDRDLPIHHSIVPSNHTTAPNLDSIVTVTDRVVMVDSISPGVGLDTLAEVRDVVPSNLIDAARYVDPFLTVVPYQGVVRNDQVGTLDTYGVVVVLGVVVPYPIGTEFAVDPVATAPDRVVLNRGVATREAHGHQRIVLDGVVRDGDIDTVMEHQGSVVRIGLAGLRGTEEMVVSDDHGEVVQVV